MSGIGLNLNQVLVNESIRTRGEARGGDSLSGEKPLRPDSIDAFDENGLNELTAKADKRDTSDFRNVLKKQLEDSGQELNEIGEDSQSSQFAEGQSKQSQQNSIKEQSQQSQQNSTVEEPEPAMVAEGQSLLFQQKTGQLNQKSEKTGVISGLISPEIVPASGDTLSFSGLGNTNSTRYSMSKSVENHTGILNTARNLLTRQIPSDTLKQTNLVGQAAGSDAALTLPKGEMSANGYALTSIEQNTASLKDANALQQAQVDNKATATLVSGATNKVPNEPILPSVTTEAKAFKQTMGQSENQPKNNSSLVQNQMIQDADATDVRLTDSATYKPLETSELTQFVSSYTMKKMTPEAVPSLVKQPDFHADINAISHTNASVEVQAVEKQASQSSIQNLFQKPIDQILNHIPTTMTGSTQQIRVSLSPEELGAVRITFKQQDEQIEGLIEIQNNEVRKDIEKSIPQIAAVLAESGIMVRRIDIAPMQNSSQPQNESFSQGFSAADQQHLAGQADYNSQQGSGSASISTSSAGQQTVATPSSGKDYDPNALNMFA